MKNSNLRFLIASGFIVFFCAFNWAPKVERNYIFQVPESKVNQYITVLQGRLQDISAKDYNDLLTSLMQQAFAQNREFLREDSLLSKKSEIKRDSVKSKNNKQ